MLIDRNDKITVKQKLVALIKRTERILERQNSNRQTSVARLRRLLQKSKQEKEIISLQIRSMEENIIKHGCPGITLYED